MTPKSFRWRLLQQALLQKKAKTLIILLAITIGASVFAALLNLQMDLRSRMNRELRDYGPNVVIQPEINVEYVPHDFLAKLQGSSMMPKVIAYTPQFVMPVEIQRRPVLLAVVNVESYRKLYPSQDWTLRESAADAIFIGKRLADKLRANDLDRLTVQMQDTEVNFVIGGFVESGEMEDDQVFISLNTGQKLGITDRGYHSVLLSVLGDLPEVESGFDTLIQNQAGVQYKVIRKIAAAESTILDKLSRLMGLVILLIFIILFFCIHTTVSGILLSRQSEIALLRVLGAKRKQITALVTTELLVIGLLGGITGYAIGMVMAQVLGKVLFQSFVTPSVIVFLFTLFFSLVLMTVSSLLPISRAVNRQAALVLKEA
jgi:putative ABC transport system permease protein